MSATGTTSRSPSATGCRTPGTGSTPARGWRTATRSARAPSEYLVGYECDGAAFDRADLRRRPRGRAHRRGRDARDFTILAVGDCRPSGWGFGNAAATMGLFTRASSSGGGGTVFTASTTDWARVLTDGTAASAVLDRITRNVLDRLSAPPT